MKKLTTIYLFILLVISNLIYGDGSLLEVEDPYTFHETNVEQELNISIKAT